MGNTESEKRDAFSRKLTDILNFGALNLAMGIGYRTRLFDVMDEMARPVEVDEISQQAALHSRYVKEWLGIMVCGGVVELSTGPSGEDLFFLPKAHGDLITRRSGNANLGVYTQEIPLLTLSAMEPVIRGFSTGEGVDYGYYPKFQAFMSQLADAKHEAVLVSRFLPSIEDGQLAAALESGMDVCDLGCGEGVAAILMAAAYPKSRFVGIDISKAAIEKAEQAAASRLLENIEFVVADAARLAHHPAFAGAFDYITSFDAIHDQPRPRAALRSALAMLKPGGRFSMVDIDAGSRLADNKNHPMGAFLYTVSLMHCMPVGLVDGGAGLGMMWGREKAVEMLREAGFTDVTVLEIPDDPFNLHFFCRNG